MGFKLLILGITLLLALSGCTDYTVIPEATMEYKLCVDEMKDTLKQVGSAIESTVNLEAETNFTYEVTDCFNTTAVMRITQRRDRAFCSEVCGEGLSECTVLQFSSPDYQETNCITINSATMFSQDISVCNQGIGTIVDLKNSSGITPGQYTLIKNIEESDNSPVICAYKQ